MALMQCTNAVTLLAPWKFVALDYIEPVVAVTVKEN